MNTRVYIADITALDDAALFERLLGTVPAYRREKALRFKFPKGQKQSLGVGLLLRRACEDFGIPGADENVLCGENGKPAFRDVPEVHFNLSHSKERVMCVVSEFETGCDVEHVREGRSKLAERFFMENETRWIRSFAELRAQDDAFYRLWTLKECYMKVTGRGLSLTPDKFSLALSPDGISLWHDGPRPEYTFRELDLEDGYRYAYCLKGAPANHGIDLVQLSLGAL